MGGRVAGEGLRRGERVRIVRGCWAQHLATVETVDPQRRWLRVAVAFFGRVVRVHVEVLDVERLREP